MSAPAPAQTHRLLPHKNERDKALALSLASIYFSDRPRSLSVLLPGVTVLGLVLLVPLFSGVALLRGFLASRLLLLVAGALFLVLRSRVVLW